MEKNSENTELNEEKSRLLFFLQEVLLFLATITLSGIAAYLYSKTTIEIAGLIILASAGLGGVIFVIGYSRESGSFLYDNADHLWRFLIVYLIFLLGSIIFPALPVGGWPFLVVFVGLMLFGNQMIGLSAGCELLMIAILLKGGSSSLFFAYFISGLIGIIVFSYINETFQVGLPVLISLLVQMVCLSVEEVLLVNEVFSWQLFIIPVVNMLVCFILLMVLLKYFSFSVIYRNRDKYMDINDPECPLLVEFKAFSKEEYYHAVHTAYLCDRIAKRLGIDDAVAKACGYYHRIGVLKGENNWENVEGILTEYRFPEEVHKVLKEYIDKNERIISKETVVLLFCDTIITSINYLFSKKPEVELDYQKIISAIFQKKLESGIIDYSSLSFGELQEMKNILVEEKLYYDFLR